MTNASIPTLAERMSHLEITRFYLFTSLKSLTVARSSWCGKSSPREGRQECYMLEEAGLSSKRTQKQCSASYFGQVT